MYSDPIDIAPYQNDFVFQDGRFNPPKDKELPAVLKSDLGKTNVILFKNIFDQELQTYIQNQLLPRTKFKLNEVNKEICQMDLDFNTQVNSYLNFMFNDAKFLEFIRGISGLNEIKRFWGRTYRLLPDPQYYMSWHSDSSIVERILGMVVNLSPKPYEGGYFQIKEKNDDRIFQIKENQIGYTHIFKINSNLVHQVTNVVGAESRIVFAGAFFTNELPNQNDADYDPQ